MALILKMLWDYRKVLAIVAVVITVAVMCQRVYTWHDAYTRIGIVEARLASEIACAVDSECHKRAAALAEQARQEAAVAAQAALEAAEKAEAKARADAAAWRKRYEAALRDDPDCADWATHKIACPIS